MSRHWVGDAPHTREEIILHEYQVRQEMEQRVTLWLATRRYKRMTAKLLPTSTISRSSVEPPNTSSCAWKPLRAG